MTNLDTASFHALCITILYAAIGLLTFVLVERLVFYGLLRGRLGALLRGLNAGPPKPAVAKGHDGISTSLRCLFEAEEAGAPHARIEDLASAVYLTVDMRVNARLWIADTIVTVAPLIGLLGTILGIMDTFGALSSGGVSDPQAVSRGIADALQATAIGIGVALYGVLSYNIMHRFAGEITDSFKKYLLTSSQG